LIDEFWCFKLSSEANALTGWKSKTAVNYGADKVTEGFEFIRANGDYIDTTFNISAGGDNYEQNNAYAEAYVHTIVNNANTTPFAAIKLEAGAGSFGFRRTGLVGPYIYSNSDTSPPRYSQDMTNGSAYGIARTNSTNFHYYKDGISIWNPNKSSIAPASVNFLIGKNGWGDLLDGKISSFLVVAGIGFNHSAHHTNLMQLFTDLA